MIEPYFSSEPRPASLSAAPAAELAHGLHARLLLEAYENFAEPLLRVYSVCLAGMKALLLRY